MQPHEVNLVLYHAGCHDGFGAALAAWQLLHTRAEYVAVDHGSPAPDVTGKHVAILDFCYPLATMQQLLAQSAGLLVLDHHKTSEAAVADLPAANKRFCMDKSGAVLAWEYFHPSKPVPLLLRYIQDRDLWQWRLPHSRAISEALFAEPRTFQAWSQRLHRRGVMALAPAGYKLLQVKRKHVEQALLTMVPARLAAFPDKKAVLVHCGQPVSEVGEAALARQPAADYAVMWHKEKEMVRYRLRARTDGTDVGEIAAALGGGGHAAAASFCLDAGAPVSLLFGWDEFVLREKTSTSKEHAQQASHGEPPRNRRRIEY